MPTPDRLVLAFSVEIQNRIFQQNRPFPVLQFAGFLAIETTALGESGSLIVRLRNYYAKWSACQAAAAVRLEWLKRAAGDPTATSSATRN